MTRYELLDRIGVGGMAEIFRGKAVAAGGFEKPVAIKRILPHLSQDKRFVELLIAEAKVLSLLKHRNIVQIFDVGLGDDAQYFLVMEYVDGKDLGAVWRGLETTRRRMPFDLALHIGAEICEALEHAHSAKAPDGKTMSLVHRDVSPSNVLLSRAGEIKLTDFGIAKRAEQEQTGSGAVRGKFAYISPEQARNEHLDPRSDVFSVAILLWELVTNRRLFSGLGDLEALRAVREAAVPRPSEIDPRLPAEVEPLLMAALARDPRRRPTAGQFGEQLRGLRYSLDVTVGDPATELAKIIDDAEKVERESQRIVAEQRRSPTGFEHFDHTEATVIRIHTADAFSLRDKDGRAMAAARQVIDRFDEEETRLAQLSGDQLRMLRGARRDSSEMTATPPSPRSKRATDEPTTARPPLHSEELTLAPGSRPVNQSFDQDEATRLVAPTNRRTPVPERIKPRPATQPPHALPGMPSPRTHTQQPPRPPTPGSPELTPPPGTVHSRHPQGLAPMPQAPPGAGGAPPMPPQAYAASSQPQPPPMMLPQQPPPQHLPTPLPQQAPVLHGGSYPGWGVQAQLPPRAASPTAPDNYERAPAPPRPSDPHVAGFRTGTQKAGGLQPWMLVVGALVMAALAFAITRAFIGG